MDTYIFGELIRRARIKRKLTQANLASMIGTGRRFVSEMEAGKSTTGLGKALEAAEILDVSIGARDCVDLPALIKSMEKPRLWSGRCNATPRMLFADVIKNPCEHDLKLVAKIYGTEHLKRMRKRLIRNQDISPMALRETERILRYLDTKTT